MASTFAAISASNLITNAFVELKPFPILTQLILAATKAPVSKTISKMFTVMAPKVLCMICVTTSAGNGYYLDTLFYRVSIRMNVTLVLLDVEVLPNVACKYHCIACMSVFGVCFF